MILRPPRHGWRVIAMAHGAARRRDLLRLDRGFAQMTIPAAFDIRDQQVGCRVGCVRRVAIGAFGHVITVGRVVEIAAQQESVWQVHRSEITAAIGAGRNMALTANAGWLERAVDRDIGAHRAAEIGVIGTAPRKLAGAHPTGGDCSARTTIHGRKISHQIVDITVAQ